MNAFSFAQDNTHKSLKKKKSQIEIALLRLFIYYIWLSINISSLVGKHLLSLFNHIWHGENVWNKNVMMTQRNVDPHPMSKVKSSRVNRLTLELKVMFSVRIFSGLPKGGKPGGVLKESIFPKFWRKKTTNNLDSLVPNNCFLLHENFTARLSTALGSPSSRNKAEYAV